MRLTTESEECAFLFQNGNIVYANTKNPEKRIGAFVVRLGLVTQDKLNQVAQDSSQSTEVYFGQRLVERGYLSSRDLKKAVRTQILEIVEEVMFWGDGAFYFDENELPFAVPEGSPTSTQSILFEATRRADERKNLRGLFPDLNMILAVNREACKHLQDPAARTLLQSIDGDYTVEQILFKAPKGSQATATLLRDLLKKGYVHQVGVRVSDSASLAVPDFQCFPVAPDVPGKLFGAFSREGEERTAFTRIVASDPMLAAKTLRTLTLVRGELPRAELNLEHLVRTLGTFQLRSILVPEAMRGLFSSAAQVYWKDWWEHAHAAAKVSRSVAQTVGYPFPEEAYLAGLLQNLGAFVFMGSNIRKYQQVVRDALRRQRSLQDLEEKAFGLSHTKAGAVFAEKWKFPKSLVHVIRHHHRADAEAGNLLLHVVAVANGVCAARNLGVEFHTDADYQFEIALKALKLPRKKATELLRQPSAPLGQEQPIPSHARPLAYDV